MKTDLKIKERPILFNSEMVRAILDGRKTQTRRVLAKGKWAHYHPDTWPNGEPCQREFLPCGDEGEWLVGSTSGESFGDENYCPYGKPGDRFWVREAWGIFSDETVRKQTLPLFEYVKYNPTTFEPLLRAGYAVAYRADGIEDLIHWRPSIHMPRWASRITLELTDVRVERVQEISIDDIEAEGVYRVEDDQDCSRDAWLNEGNFMRLWDSINAKRGFPWASNPWVWVIEFKQMNQEQ